MKQYLARSGDVHPPALDRCAHDQLQTNMASTQALQRSENIKGVIQVVVVSREVDDSNTLMAA